MMPPACNKLISVVPGVDDNDSCGSALKALNEEIRPNSNTIIGEYNEKHIIRQELTLILWGWRWHVLAI